MSASSFAYDGLNQVTVLAITGRVTEADSLRRAFANSNWRLDVVSTLAEAGEFLASGAVPVIICAEEVADGHWEALLQRVQRRQPDSFVIVISRTADDASWGEILHLGGYDVLPVPLDSREVCRVVALAWRQWRDRNRRISEESEEELCAAAAR